MSDNSYGLKPRQLFILLAITVLASGGAFFWSNWPARHKSGSLGAAEAAPKPKAPASAMFPKKATKAERTAAQKTISSQLHAFDTGNWQEAVKFQSEGLKGNFSSPEAFGQMIQTMYPAFVQAKRVQYGRAININGNIQFEVVLLGQDNSTTRAIYSLVKEKGNYRIASVMGGESAPRSTDSDWA